jgi:serine/threonine protein kinase
MAPELYRSYERGYNKSADLWAIGIVLYACLSGSMPFQSNQIDKAENLIGDDSFMYPDRDWKHISQTVKLFLSKSLLVADGIKRIRAEKSVGNEWFTDDQQLIDGLSELELVIKMENEPYWLTKYLTSS